MAEPDDRFPENEAYLRPDAPPPTNMRDLLKAYHLQLRRVQERLVPGVNEVLPALGPDTCLALGICLGDLGKVLALIGRDIDGFEPGPGSEPAGEDITHPEPMPESVLWATYVDLISKAKGLPRSKVDQRMVRSLYKALAGLR